MASARIHLKAVQSVALLLGCLIGASAHADEVGTIASQYRARLIDDVTWNLDQGDHVTGRLTDKCKIIRLYVGQPGQDNYRIDCFATPFQAADPFSGVIANIQVKKVTPDAAPGDLSAKVTSPSVNARLTHDSLLERMTKDTSQPTSNPTRSNSTIDEERIASIARKLNYPAPPETRTLSSNESQGNGWANVLDCKHKARINTVAGLSTSTYVGSNLATDESARLLVRGTGAGVKLVEAAAPRVIQIARSTPWKVGWAVVLVTSGVVAAYQWVSCD